MASQDELDGFASCAGNIRGAKPPSSPTAVASNAILSSSFLQGDETLRHRNASASRKLTSPRSATNHEFLHVEPVVGVGAAVDHVHHRHRHGHRAGYRRGNDAAASPDSSAAARAIGHRHREDGVGTEVATCSRCRPAPACVLIDEGLVGPHRGQSLASEISVFTCSTACSHAFAEVAGLASPSRSSMASRLNRWTRPTGTAARPRTPDSSRHIGLNGRVATGVQNFSGDDVNNGAHAGYLMVSVKWLMCNQ
jgi:hypothetical protein